MLSTISLLFLGLGYSLESSLDKAPSPFKRFLPNSNWQLVAIFRDLIATAI